MGSANSQSPLCWQEAAKNDARWYAEARLASTLALDSSTPGRSQIGCLVGSMSGTSQNLAYYYYYYYYSKLVAKLPEASSLLPSSE